ncbi:MAG: translation initiation factor IF-2 subunit alpha [Candidatus Thorarchaeota archaeon]
MVKDVRNPSFASSKLPEVGDLVIATIHRITSHGAYGKMDEYDNNECFIHISEIASTWVRNIRNFVRENQKVVIKVLRVDAERKQVDTSLRRVTKEQGRMKIQEWKRAQRGSKLLALAAERMKKSPEAAYDIAGKAMEANYSDILEALEVTKEEGPKILTDIGIPKKWAEVLYELAQAHVILRDVSVETTIELTCRGPEGVEGIRKALIAAEEIVGSSGGLVYLEGAPRYRIQVSAKDYKQAEQLLEKAVKKSLEIIGQCGGEGQIAVRS